MANFNEHALEMSIMELFKDEGYTYVSGDQIHRERTEVLLTDDLKQYLYNRYAKDGITPSEVDSVILMLRNISGTIYEANKAVFKLLCDGFILNREDRTQKDLYIELIDFDTPENNIFKVVNQFEIEGVNNQLRIPDGIVFVNGIPVVVLEFKSAVQENTTIMDAYKQLTIRYRRDIPEIFKYNAFVVISDGANNKYGSFFSPYDFFYAWRKINSDDKELDGTGGSAGGAGEGASGESPRGSSEKPASASDLSVHPAAFACSGERRAGFISMALNRPVSCNVVLYSFNRSSFQYCPSIHGLSLLR